MKSTTKYYLETHEIKEAIKSVIPDLKDVDFHILSIIPTAGFGVGSFKMEIEIDNATPKN